MFHPRFVLPYFVKISVPATIHGINHCATTQMYIPSQRQGTKLNLLLAWGSLPTPTLTLPETLTPSAVGWTTKLLDPLQRPPCWASSLPTKQSQVSCGVTDSSKFFIPQWPVRSHDYFQCKKDQVALLPLRHAHVLVQRHRRQVIHFTCQNPLNLQAR